jgi:hypothetical protein
MKSQGTVPFIINISNYLELRCCIAMDPSTFTKPSEKYGQALNTAFLPSYVREVVLSKLQEQGTPLDLEAGDQIKFRQNALEFVPPSIEYITTTSFEILEVLDDLEYILEDRQGFALVGVPIPLRMLTRSDSSTPLSLQLSGSDSPENIKRYTELTVKALVPLLDGFCSRPDYREERLRCTSESNLARCARAVARFVNELMHQEYHIGASKLITSIIILLESIERVAELVFGEYFNSALDTAYFPILQEWCPSRTHHLLNIPPTTSRMVIDTLPSHDSRPP